MSLVTLELRTGPDITDPALLRTGIQANAQVYSPDDSEADTLFETYRRHKQPKKFFAAGRVFSILWVEPPGEATISDYETGTAHGRYGDRVVSKVRRFVVVREGTSYSSAVPIATYGGHGVATRGVVKSHHSIITTAKQAPSPLREEMPTIGELPMQPIAIRVVPDDKSGRLDMMARLDYRSVYTVQHDVRVKSFGMVDSQFLAALCSQFKRAWAGNRDDARSETIRAGPSQTLQNQEDPPQRQNPAQELQHDLSIKTGERKQAQASSGQLMNQKMSPASADSGPISDEAMRAIIQSYTDHARTHGYSMPAQALNSRQLHALAADSRIRAVYLQRIREGWGWKAEKGNDDEYKADYDNDEEEDDSDEGGEEEDDDEDDDDDD